VTKVAIIGDTHFGVRNDNLNFHSYFRRFYEDVFFPEIDARGIRHLVHLGDLVDRRKYIQYLTSNLLHDTFMGPVFDRGLEFHIMAGNHDCTYKHTNEVNAIRSLYGHSKHQFHLYERPETVEIAGLEVCMVPWVCADNEKDFYLEMSRTKAQVCMGHLELAGFEMDRGHIAEHGMDLSHFSKFDVVLSGHYHHKSTVGNISYLGSPCQFTWADYDDVKGFHVLDTETRELEFIRNPYEVFRKYFYDDARREADEMLAFDPNIYVGSYVKVVIKNKNDNGLFDTVMNRIESGGPADIQIVEDHLNLDSVSEEDLVDEAQDTVTILKKYVQGIDTPVDRKRIETFLRDLYEEALTVE
jgi:DNA repair exonuclease SbcCD nuclease subunit